MPARCATFSIYHFATSGFAFVAISEEDSLHHREVWAREKRVTRVTASSMSKVPDILPKNSHGLVTLLDGQAWNVYRCLKDGAVVSGEVYDMVSDLPGASLAGAEDIEGVCHLCQDFRHAIIRDVDAQYLGRVDTVRNRRDRGL